MLYLTQMQFSGESIQHVFLNQGMDHNGYQRVEEHTTRVLLSNSVQLIVQAVRGWRKNCRISCRVMVDSDKHGSNGSGHLCNKPICQFSLFKFKKINYLENQSDDKNHCDTSNNVRMVLDDKLMAENWGVFTASSTTFQCHRVNNMLRLSCLDF
jgi:hypothetical protein